MNAHMIRPWNSVFQKSEDEAFVVNIAKFLFENGGEWRDVSEEEYNEWRIPKGMGRVDSVRFRTISRYTKSEDTARLVSKGWDFEGIKP